MPYESQLVYWGSSAAKQQAASAERQNSKQQATSNMQHAVNSEQQAGSKKQARINQQPQHHERGSYDDRSSVTRSDEARMATSPNAQTPRILFQHGILALTMTIMSAVKALLSTPLTHQWP